jgi:hypothetical protein
MSMFLGRCIFLEKHEAPALGKEVDDGATRQKTAASPVAVSQQDMG